jgi:hypothetical protein
VRGTVVANDSARTPLRRALVTLSRIGLEDLRPAATDDEGRFVFVELPAGTYSLTATKGGFIGMSAGAIKPGMPGRQIVVREGDTAEIAPIALPRGAVIAGRVHDAAGRPVGNAQVQASRFVVVNGERQLRSGPATWNATTNDHGDYRIFGLFAGEYLISAWQNGTMFQSDVTAADLDAAQKPAAAATAQSPPVARPFALAPTLYPGTVDETSATPIALMPGEERLGVDLALQRVPVARVSGTVTGMDGKPVAGANVLRFLRRAPAFTPVVGFGVATAADGSFSVAGLAPGDYVLHVRGTSAVQTARTEELVRLGLGGTRDNTQGQWASTDVTVNGADVVGVSLRMQPGMAVSGTVAVPASRGRVDVTRARVQLSPVAAGTAPRSFGASVVDAQNAFRIDGVTPGRYALSIVGLPAGYSARSALVGDVDVLDTPFEVRPGAGISGIVITLTDASTELGGILTNASGQPASHLYVLAFSQNRAHWVRNSRRILSAKAGEDGSYAISGLPPGTYFLCALTEIDTTLQYEPVYLDELVPASIKLSLGDGEKKIQHLRAGG